MFSKWNQQLLRILEALYNAPRRSANQIYMFLIILLILRQDSSFNASIHIYAGKNYIYLVIKKKELHLFVVWLLHKDCIWHRLCGQMLPGVPWYKERLLHQTSLGSLMVIILIRTVQYNLSKLRVWLQWSILLSAYVLYVWWLYWN